MTQHRTQEAAIRNEVILAGARLVNAMGLPALLGNPNAGSIFMLHSLVAPQDGYFRPAEHNSPDFLETVLRRYAARGFVFVSMDDALRCLDDPRAEKFIAFTFDDGYRDNLTTVLPLFERYGCPFAVYATTDMVERRARYWWGGLKEVVQRADSVDYEPGGWRFAARTPAEKIRAYDAISLHVRAGLSRPEDVERLMARHGLGNMVLMERDMLGREELLTLSRHPLVTIGGHTDTHRSLTQLPLEEARREMTQNQQYLEDLVQKPVRHFAYPFGDSQSCGKREYALAREVGFASAVTTRRGNLSSTPRPDRHALPRVLFSGVREAIGYLELQRTGLLTRTN